MSLKKFISVVAIIAIVAGALCSCTSKKHVHIPHRFASAEEGRELMLSNEDNYYSHFSQNDLDYKMQKTGATMSPMPMSATQNGTKRAPPGSVAR